MYIFPMKFRVVYAKNEQENLIKICKYWKQQEGKWKYIRALCEHTQVRWWKIKRKKKAILMMAVFNVIWCERNNGIFYIECALCILLFSIRLKRWFCESFFFLVRCWSIWLFIWQCFILFFFPSLKWFHSAYLTALDF